jgi:hypothetical protein
MESLGFPREVFRFWTPEEVEALLRNAGFENVRVERPADPAMKWLSVLASKASAR